MERLRLRLSTLIIMAIERSCSTYTQLAAVYNTLYRTSTTCPPTTTTYEGGTYGLTSISEKRSSFSLPLTSSTSRGILTTLNSS